MLMSHQRLRVFSSDKGLRGFVLDRQWTPDPNVHTEQCYGKLCYTHSKHCRGPSPRCGMLLLYRYCSCFFLTGM
jgi:hypothetical protein